MVVFSERSPFLQDEDGNDPVAVGSQHIRSLKLLKSIVQVRVPQNSLLPKAVIPGVWFLFTRFYCGYC